MSDVLPDLLLAIDQQLVSPRTPYVAATMQRLLDGGLDAAEVKAQMACCLGEELERVMLDRRAFDEAAYRQCLDALPACI